MNNKRSLPTATEPRTKKMEWLSTNDTFATESNTESAKNPLDLLVSAAKVVTDSASSSDRSSTPGAVTPDTSHNGADETTSDVVNVPGLDNSLVAQPFKPRVQSTLSPVLAAEPITPAPMQSYALPSSSLPPPPLFSYATTSRHTLKKPTMAFKYAIYRIVNNEDYQHWVKWNDEGDQLHIGNWDFFVDTLIDMGFGATGRTSVMKNFHGYGFKLESDGRCRVPDENGIVWTILYHERFLRDQPELLKDIKRVATLRRL
ncbi:hypothetical protein GGI17_003473 [Coemansia sp. S146]|nr:hypothetical protein GGI17_003473 [Coemansia sp. S146]